MPHPLTRLYLWGAYRLPHTYRYMLLLLLPLVLCVTDIAAHYSTLLVLLIKFIQIPYPVLMKAQLTLNTL